MAHDAGRESSGDDELEATTHSFVLKIWLEERAQIDRPALWRGYITHVTSGERRYITDLDDIDEFIVRYLPALGVRPVRHYPVKWWVQRQKARLARRKDRR